MLARHKAPHKQRKGVFAVKVLVQAGCCCHRPPSSRRDRPMAVVASAVISLKRNPSYWARGTGAPTDKINFRKRRGREAAGDE